LTKRLALHRADGFAIDLDPTGILATNGNLSSCCLLKKSPRAGRSPNSQLMVYIEFDMQLIWLNMVYHGLQYCLMTRQD
jgi:hypothetical protein